jgi:Na+-transporting methylmalonyl-CoA/oxaloacetate decarboxylase beta subunit
VESRGDDCGGALLYLGIKRTWNPFSWCPSGSNRLVNIPMSGLMDEGDCCHFYKRESDRNFPCLIFMESGP